MKTTYLDNLRLTLRNTRRRRAQKPQKNSKRWADTAQKKTPMLFPVFHGRVESKARKLQFSSKHDGWTVRSTFSLNFYWCGDDVKQEAKYWNSDLAVARFTRRSKYTPLVNAKQTAWTLRKRHSEVHARKYIDRNDISRAGYESDNASPRKIFDCKSALCLITCRTNTLSVSFSFLWWALEATISKCHKLSMNFLKCW